MPVGVVLLAAAVASLLLGVVFGRYRFRCYESGLTRRRGRDELRLLYDEITEFTYSATRMFYKGAYTGTQLSLTFRAPRADDPLFGQGAEHGRRSRRAPRPHRQDDCPSHAGRVAGRPAVPWMSDVVFLPQGLQFRRSKMLGLASGPVEIRLTSRFAA